MKNGYKVMLKYITLHKRKVIVLVLLLILNSFFGTFPLKIIEKLIDTVEENFTITCVLALGGIYFFTQVVWVILGGVVNRLTAKLETGIGHNIRMELYEKILHLPLGYFEKNNSGDIMLRLIQDSEITVEGVLTPIIFITLNVFQFILGFYFISSISVTVALWMIPIGVLLIFLSLQSGTPIRNLTKKQRDCKEQLWNDFQEGIKNIKVLKLLKKEKAYFEKVEDSSTALAKESLKLNKYTMLIDRLYSTLFMLLIAFIMIYGCVQVKNNELSIGGLSALMMYNGILIDPMLNFFDFYQQFQQVSVGVNQIAQILEEKEENLRAAKEQQIRYEKEILIKNLTFSYQNKEVLHNISGKITKGEHIALVGISGSGKSTLYDILTGFYEINKNQVFIDGKDLMELSITNLRELIQMVFQDTGIFAGTIRDNLKLFDEQITDEQIYDALEEVGLKQMVDKLSSRLDTVLSENGENLSGGEKQRLMLARVFLMHRPILILDEAFSALDTITSTYVFKNILKAYKNDTIIITTHKLEGIVEECDRVLVFQDGKIENSGTHKTLLEESELYRKLYYMNGSI